jgi:hypothetical protein
MIVLFWKWWRRRERRRKKRGTKEQTGTRLLIQGEESEIIACQKNRKIHKNRNIGLDGFEKFSPFRDVFLFLKECLYAKKNFSYYSNQDFP